MLLQYFDRPHVVTGGGSLKKIGKVTAGTSSIVVDVNLQSLKTIVEHNKENCEWYPHLMINYIRTFARWHQLLDQVVSVQLS